MGFRIVIDCIEIKIIEQRPRTIISRGTTLLIRANLARGRLGRRLRRRRYAERTGVQSPVILVGTELALEPKVGVLEEDAGMEEAGAADSELVKSGPAAGRLGGAGKEIGDDGRNDLVALGLPADVSDHGGELGAGAGEPSPVPRVLLELEEDVHNDVVGELREESSGHRNSNLSEK
ncbi:hypothetical protein COP2_008507 [Malus domestica]